LIQFEVFDPCETNEVVNIIDTVPPASAMVPLPPETLTVDFPISWSGIDPIGEIEFYTVFVSTDGDGFTPLIERTSSTSAVFPGAVGKTYEFICIATDMAGNAEIKESVPEAVTHVIGGSPIADAGGPYEGTPGVPVVVDASGSYDPDGEIVLYEWDWDSDASYDHMTVDPLCEVTWPDEFSGDIVLRVTDNDGLSSVDTASVIIGITKPEVVDDLVELYIGQTRYDRRTGQFSCDVTVTNTSEIIIGTPVWLVIESISDPSVTVANADGTTADGKPYIGLSSLLGDDQLDPGESVVTQAYFNNPSRARFTFEPSVRGVILP
jgi:hypothetical protein